MFLKNLKQILNENRIFQNNFIKISMIEDELALIFPENTPIVKFDNSGAYILLDNFQIKEYDQKPMSKFLLIPGELVDFQKQITKYYLEFFKAEEPADIVTSTEEEKPSE